MMLLTPRYDTPLTLMPFTRIYTMLIAMMIITKRRRYAADAAFFPITLMMIHDDTMMILLIRCFTLPYCHCIGFARRRRCHYADADDAAS